MFTPTCACCELHAGDPLCTGCRDDWFATDTARCPRCAVRQPADLHVHVCGRCLAAPPAFDAAIAATDYAPPVDRMVIALKFGQRLDLARPFGQLVARAVRAAAGRPPLDDPLDPALGPSLLVPVPLSCERLRERGYNQAREIARTAARALRLPLGEPLLRVGEAPPQEGLSSEARRGNVAGAFVARAALHGTHALLVDDVLTTGATADAAARALKAAGAVRVTVLVVCRTP